MPSSTRLSTVKPDGSIHAKAGAAVVHPARMALPMSPGRHLLFALIVSVLAALPAAAATQEGTVPRDPSRFETSVVVTPERGETPRDRVPAAVDVLEGKVLQSLPAVVLGETLSFVPGFHVERGELYAGRPIVSARGFFGGGEADYVLLLVDGVPVRDTESGVIDWSLLQSSSIKRIEAFRGPGASMYGDSAIGGVIQVLTNRDTGGGSITATGGSFNTFTIDGSYNQRFVPAGIWVSGVARGTDGYSAHSAARHYGGSGGADGRLGQATWRASGSAYHRNGEDPGALSLEAFQRDPSGSDPLFRFDELQRRHLSTAFMLQAPAGKWGLQARVHADGRHEDLTRTILLAPGLGDGRERRLSTAAMGGSFDSERALGPASGGTVVRFGVDLSRERLDNAYRPVNPAGLPGGFGSEVSGRRLRGGAFMSAAWQPVDRVRASGALRWDGVDDEGFGAAAPDAQSHTSWSPRVGAAVRLNDSGKVSVFSQVSKAFKVPPLDQLFDPRPYPDFRGGTFTISNRTLVPQRATNVEAGIAGGFATVSWSALAYRMTVEDEIDFDVQTFSYANIGRSRHVGAEVEGRVRVGRLEPSATYALTKVVDVHDERQLKNVPRHRFTAAINVELPLALAAYVRYRHTAGGFLDDQNQQRIDGPSALDLRVRQTRSRFSLFVDALNVTGDRYQEYGFTLTDFRGAVVPYVYPGAGRAVRGGVTVTF